MVEIAAMRNIALSFSQDEALKICSLASTQAEDLKNLTHPMHTHSTFLFSCACETFISVGSCSRSFFSRWEDMHFEE